MGFGRVALDRTRFRGVCHDYGEEKQSAPAGEQSAPGTEQSAPAANRRDRGGQVYRRATTKNEQILAGQKADVVAELQDDQHYGEAMLVIHNRGPAEAREVRIFLDDEALVNQQLFSAKEAPLEQQSNIRPGDKLVFRYLKSEQDPDEVLVTVTWVDDSDTPGEFRNLLRTPR